MHSPPRSTKSAACSPDPMTELRFRNATLRDVDAIVALVESAYRGDAIHKVRRLLA